mmetsp:Transcript_59817/g.177288  ORF Transcript_59817/g.177288 Transcript_59817/m.177288 type:complete len:252 (+) Transcript_59817:426-1181(+)
MGRNAALAERPYSPPLHLHQARPVPRRSALQAEAIEDQGRRRRRQIRGVEQRQQAGAVLPVAVHGELSHASPGSQGPRRGAPEGRTERVRAAVRRGRPVRGRREAVVPPPPVHRAGAPERRTVDEIEQIEAVEGFAGGIGGAPEELSEGARGGDARRGGGRGEAPGNAPEAGHRGGVAPESRVQGVRTGRGGGGGEDVHGGDRQERADAEVGVGGDGVEEEQLQLDGVVVRGEREGLLGRCRLWHGQWHLG